jgi:GAF domain-containing protein
VPPTFAEAEGTVFRPAPGGALDEVLNTGRTAHVSDLAATRSYIERHPRAVEAVEIAGIRTTLGVPMVKDSVLIGIIGLFRQQVRPFNDKQIELVTDFATQAVIAIENARLLNELRQRTTDLAEALEQQTAASEVLQVISSSTGDLEPVFESLLRNATQLCKASIGTLYLHEEGRVRLVAAHDMPAEFSKAQRSYVTVPAPGGPLEVALKARQAVKYPIWPQPKPTANVIRAWSMRSSLAVFGPWLRYRCSRTMSPSASSPSTVAKCFRSTISRSRC